ncbi:MAG TPA: hypothetical protein VJK07_04400 [Candidatus Nanoarchaeia archaeon]|nr:hypothetical protein [Candidatus Nanoarchaeia archaeon]
MTRVNIKPLLGKEDLHKERVVALSQESQPGREENVMYIGFETDGVGTTYKFVRNNGELGQPIVQRINIPESLLVIAVGRVILPESLSQEFFENFNDPLDAVRIRDHRYCLEALERGGLA